MAGTHGLLVAVVLGLVCALVERNRIAVHAISLKAKASAKNNTLHPAEQGQAEGDASDPVEAAEGQARPSPDIREVSNGTQSNSGDRIPPPDSGASSGGKGEVNQGSRVVGTATGFSELASKSGDRWYSLLEFRLAQEMFAYSATQAVLVIDGGSSKTQPVLFKMMTSSRPGMPRVVFEESILMIGEGTKRDGVRTILENFLDGTIGDGWESRPLEEEKLHEHYDSLEAYVERFVGEILEEAAMLLEQLLSVEEQITSRMLGVPVLFDSTAGIRAFPMWCASALFVAIRHSINAHTQVRGFKFYTDPELSRTLSGEEEGVSAFLTANHLLRNLNKIKQEASEGIVTMAHEQLFGIVEVGGASMQIVFPTPVTTLPPASVHVVDLQQAGYLSRVYAPVHAFAVSYMQLGANSASGTFLKGLCSGHPYLQNGVCYNPCFLKNFVQECSAGPVTITNEGDVVVDTDLKKNRLRPLATYCGEANEDVKRRHTTRLTCVAAGMNPTGTTLLERVSIPHCEKIVGTGDFTECARSVDNILLNSVFALPANTEAEGVGFDTPGQIFTTLSSSAPVLVTGASTVFPLKNLMKAGLLGEDFNGDPEQLQSAASRYCSTPMQKDGNRLVVRVGSKEVKIDHFTYEDCLRVAFTYGLLLRLNTGKKKPTSVAFSTKIVDPSNGTVLGSAGWLTGRIFKEVQARDQWSTKAYENGPVYASGFA